MTEYFIKEFGNESYLCTRNIQVGDTLKECFLDGKERKVHHFETVLPHGIYVFEPWPAKNEDTDWFSAKYAFKVIGNIKDILKAYDNKDS